MYQINLKFIEQDLNVKFFEGSSIPIEPASIL